jgi:uncharacterized protein (TIGR03437 family)
MPSPKTVKFLKFACVLSVIPALIYAHEYGPDPRYTGAPGDNATACVKSQCHIGTVNSAANGGSVQIVLPGDNTYIPGVTQHIKVLVTDANRQSWGFQMTARLASNLSQGQAGSFAASDASTQVICDSGSNAPCPASLPVQFVEHNLTGWQASVNHKGSYTYQFDWTPPATNVGNVTLYAAGNASNSVNTFAPDASTGHIYTANVTLTPAVAGTLPSISANGVVSAGNFGGFTSAGPGSWIEIYGSSFTTSNRSWALSDFNGSAAPTSLDNVKVSVGGQAAYVSYISPGQVNAQIPANVSPGAQPVVVTNASGSSAPYNLTINSTMPGLLAPPSFIVGGKQYLGAFHSDLTTFVLPPGAIAGVTSAYAKPGETIIVYGVGFGAVTPSSVSFAGQVVPLTPSNSLANPFSMTIGGLSAPLPYSGLSPGFVGLYQFNVTVPQIANNDLVPLTFTLAGTPGTQTLYIAVHN